MLSGRLLPVPLAEPRAHCSWPRVRASGADSSRRTACSRAAMQRRGTSVTCRSPPHRDCPALVAAWDIWKRSPPGPRCSRPTTEQLGTKVQVGRGCRRHVSWPNSPTPARHRHNVRSSRQAEHWARPWVVWPMCCLPRSSSSEADSREPVSCGGSRCGKRSKPNSSPLFAGCLSARHNWDRTRLSSARRACGRAAGYRPTRPL